MPQKANKSYKKQKAVRKTKHTICCKPRPHCHSAKTVQLTLIKAKG